MTIRSALVWAKKLLNDSGISNPQLDAEVLLAHVLGTARSRLYMDMNMPLNHEDFQQFESAILRRSKKEPVAYITGKKEFFGRTFEVDRNVLIPRPETEILVEEAIKLAPKNCSILELGTGSGAIVISMLLERSDLKGFGCDISPQSILVANKNVKAHGVDHRLNLFASDLLSATHAQFSLIVTNPPYIATDDTALLEDDVLLYEPRQALFAGSDGLEVIKRILEESKDHLHMNGLLIMEIGYNQKNAIEQLAENTSFVIKRWVNDISGITRVVVLERIYG